MSSLKMVTRCPSWIFSPYFGILKTLHECLDCWDFGVPLKFDAQGKCLTCLSVVPCLALKIFEGHLRYWFYHPAELDKARIKHKLFFGSLQAVCMRLLRKALATRASSWIYKLSDIQRSREKIMLPQESESCHLPRVRNRKERWGQVSRGLYFIPHWFSWLTQCWFTFSLWGESFYLLLCFDSDLIFFLCFFPLPLNSFK